MISKDKTKCLILLFGLFFCLCGGSLSVLADKLPPGAIIGDESGLRVEKDGKYFIEHKDIKPGLTFSKKITISNYDKKEPFDLRMDMKADKVSGKVDLLETIDVTLDLDGKEIYSGSLSGKSNTSLPLYLGKLKAGDTKVLDATFKVDTSLPAEDWKEENQADFYWVFYESKEDVLPKKVTKTPDIKKKLLGFLPKTGEDFQLVLLGIGIGILVLVSGLIIKKRKMS